MDRYSNNQGLYQRSIRLKDYDYSQPGAYFVTICAFNRAILFGNIHDGKMHPSDIGRVVESEWQRTAEIRKRADLDAFVVMPNHIHGILIILDPVEAHGVRRSGEGTVVEHQDAVGDGTRRVHLHGDQRSIRSAQLPGDQQSTRRVHLHGDQGSARSAQLHGNQQSARSAQLRRGANTLGSIIAGYKSAVTRQARCMKGCANLGIWQRNYYEHIIRDEKSLNRIREYIANNPMQWHLDRENPDRTGDDEFDLWLDSIQDRPDFGRNKSPGNRLK